MVLSVEMVKCVIERSRKDRMRAWMDGVEVTVRVWTMEDGVEDVEQVEGGKWKGGIPWFLLSGRRERRGDRRKAETHRKAETDGLEGRGGEGRKEGRREGKRG